MNTDTRKAAQTAGETSYFDGGVGNFLGEAFLALLLASFTCGIMYPWALTKVYGWQARHTVIQGKRLVFNGKAMDLFVNILKWMLLTLVTFGIYSIWASIEMEKWRVKNTTFA